MTIIKTLRECGYKAKGEVMNAMYFNVPQSRERVIIIGVREDLGIEPSHPKPNNKPITTRQAIGHLPLGVQGKHEPQIIAAWYKSKPNQSLRQACSFVGSFQSVRLDPERPSPTQIKAHLNWHYEIPRHLTIQEAGCIQSFPDSFKFAGKKMQSKEQIGNSVPPNLMKAIAEHIKVNILEKA